MHRRIARQICVRFNKHFERFSLMEYWIYEVDIDDPEFPSPRSLVDSYDICDWKYIDFNESKLFRK